MKDLIIERGVDIPKHQRSKGYGKWQEIISKMEVGDSILMDRKSAFNLYSALYRNKFKAVMRCEGANARVWKGDAR